MNELYQKDNKEWCLSKFKIKCTQGTETSEQITDDKPWFETFASMHEDFIIDEILEISYTDEQKARLAEIQGIGFEHIEELHDYVLNGRIKVDSAIFKDKLVKSAISELEDLVAGVIGGAI